MSKLEYEDRNGEDGADMRLDFMCIFSPLSNTVC